ncbi:MAG TPA: flagellar basal body rod protein FlgB [Acidobacteriota bacterium]|nr:flagellar basal body rod protein FlgB [Acidobacteriota bacterium]
MRIEDSLLSTMSRFLDYAAQKQKLIASNVANAETPGYRSKELRFEDFLAAERLAGEEGGLRRTLPQHVSGRPTLVRARPLEASEGDEAGYDENNVELEKELVELAENVMKFTTTAQFLRQKLQLVRSSIKEGRA